MSTSDLPALPANEKTYAGIPEAVFVVSAKLLGFIHFLPSNVV